ncbi:putative UNC93-like protein 3 [Forsythia ovata]|uniref:UNC93-like protein 3 n=1 Tax=Forsythia ovata TaxID=205694 RepID=A0ABD1QDC7_9LAMI
MATDEETSINSNLKPQERCSYFVLGFPADFFSLWSCPNLESTINTEGDLRTISLGILYSSFTFFSVLASLVVRKLGSKNALILGTTGYWLFIAANLKPTWSLNNNSFSGPIPPSIGKVSRLPWLDLSYNKLSDTIPVASPTASGLDMLSNARHLYEFSFRVIKAFRIQFLLQYIAFTISKKSFSFFTAICQIIYFLVLFPISCSVQTRMLMKFIVE